LAKGDIARMHKNDHLKGRGGRRGSAMVGPSIRHATFDDMVVS